MKIITQEEIFSGVQEDYESRFAAAQNDFEETLRDYPRLVNKMLELWQMCDTSYYGLFCHVTHGGGLRTLGEVEGFLSFIGNFYDDASYRLVYKLSDMEKSMIESRCKVLGKKVEYPDPKENMRGWTVKYANDDEPDHLSEDVLIEHIDKQIAFELNYREIVLKWVDGDWNDSIIPQSWRDYKFGKKT